MCLFGCSYWVWVVVPPDHIPYIEVPYYISWPNLGCQISFCVPAVLKINSEMIYKIGKKKNHYNLFKFWNYDQQCLWTCLWHQSLTESIKSWERDTYTLYDGAQNGSWISMAPTLPASPNSHKSCR